MCMCIKPVQGRESSDLGVFSSIDVEGPLDESSDVHSGKFLTDWPHAMDSDVVHGSE